MNGGLLPALTWPEYSSRRMVRWWWSPVKHLLLNALVRTAENPGTSGGPGRWYPTGWDSAQSVHKKVEHMTLPALAMGEPTRWNPGGRGSAQNTEKPMDNKSLPAVLDTTLDDRWHLSPPNWMDERLRGTPAYYPHALISYYHWKDVKFRFPKDSYIFGDSGGFSIMTLAAVVDPRDVIRWQLRNCTVGVLLDVPPRDPRRTKGKSEGSDFIWNSAVKSTVANATLALPQYEEARKKGTAFRWWGVCQGGTLSQLKQWYDSVAKVYPFDDEGEGWAFKPYPRINAENTARVLGFIKQRKVRRAHFLMTTGVETVATLLALGPEAGLDLVTYDSSSASAAGINRVVYVPRSDFLDWSTLEEKTRASGGTDRTVRDFLQHKCQCPSCNMLREDMPKVPPKLLDEYWKYRMIFHNTLAMLRVFETLSAASKSDPHGMLKEILGHQKYSATLQAFEGRLAVKGVVEGTPRGLLDAL